MPPDGEEKDFVGTDGKVVQLKHSKTITSRPWYVEKSSKEPVISNYEKKRDAYEGYDPETYKAVIQSFSAKSKGKKRRKASQKLPDAPIYDTYSRTTQVESKRDRSDTAHYLKDLCAVGEGLEFDQGHELEAASPNSNSKQDDAPSDADILQATSASRAGHVVNDSPSA